ncbi:MAG: hypothetical protein GY702_13585 [Desulfobulbaceae bacterium]|nr:hypothetical protein [Desulfobulbaceae bacterium]
MIPKIKEPVTDLRGAGEGLKDFGIKSLSLVVLQEGFMIPKLEKGMVF